MRSKNLLLCVASIALIFCSINFVYSTGLSCSFQDTCVDSNNVQDPDRIIMSLSNITNAHGEIWSFGEYTKLLCCNFEDEKHECTDTNKILGLSSETNAHAEIPDGNIEDGTTNYETNVCFDNMECYSNSTPEAECESNEIPLLSLSAKTNAHLGDFDAYPIKICCKAKLAYWADETGVITNIDPIVTETTTITLSIANTDFTEGTVDFTIKEKDDFLNPDDYIITIPGEVDSNGNAEVSWTITQADLSEAGKFERDEYTFYFVVEKGSQILTSGDLFTRDVLAYYPCDETLVCGDYETKEECRGNNCELAGNSEAGCGDQTPIEDGCYYETNCACRWNATAGEEGTGICESITEEVFMGACESGEEYPTTRGKCSIQETTEDNCDDGFLTYSWIASWDWQDNVYTSESEVPGDSEPMEDPEGTFHYPNDKWSKCTDKSNTIPCPAQIQLPFFGFFNFFISLLLIGLIYVLMNFNQGNIKWD